MTNKHKSDRTNRRRAGRRGQTEARGSAGHVIRLSCLSLTAASRTHISTFIGFIFFDICILLANANI